MLSLALKLFPVITICVGIGWKLSLNYLDSWHSNQRESSALTDSYDRILDDTSCLQDGVACAKNALNQFDELLFESSNWSPIGNSSSYLLKYSSSNNNSIAMYYIHVSLNTEWTQNEVFQYLSTGEGNSIMYPRLLSGQQAVVIAPPLLSYDYYDALIDIVNVQARLFWPLYTRTFAVMNTAHEKSATFVSKSIPLSPLDTKVFLEGHRVYGGSRSAQIYLAFRISNVGVSQTSTFGNANNKDNKKSKSNNHPEKKKHTSGSINRNMLNFDILYSLSDMVESQSLNSYLTQHLIIANMVEDIFAVFP